MLGLKEMWGAIPLAAMICTLACGMDSVFFRVVSTQQTRITSISSDGTIVWSNSAPDAVAHLEWSPSPDGIWITNDLAATIQENHGEARCVVPKGVLDGTGSTLVARSFTTIIGSSRGVPIDINNDGRAEIRFMQSFITTCMVGDGGGIEVLDAYDCDIITEPQPRGTLLGPPSTNTVAYRYHNYPTWIASRDGMPINNPYPWRGPWGSVTNAYLAIRFPIRDRMHYGWLNIERVDLPVGGAPNDDHWTAWRARGCAYETIPEKGIVAGATR